MLARFLILFIAFVGTQVHAKVFMQDSTAVPVIINNDTLLNIYTGTGIFTKEQRAKAIKDKISDLIDSQELELDSLAIKNGVGTVDIWHKGNILISVTSADAKHVLASKRALADHYVLQIRQTLNDDVRFKNIKSKAIRIGVAFVISVIIFFLMRFLNKFFRKLRLWLRLQKGKRLKGLKMKNLEVLTIDRQLRLFLLSIQVVRITLYALIVYFYLAVLSSFLPWTQKIAEKLIHWVANPAQRLFWGVLHYLPNLFTVAVILAFTYYSIRVMRFFVREMEKGNLYIAGFHKDWIQPTFKIVVFLSYAFAAVVIFPYLPGSNSPAFKNITIFLGILFSLGSTTAVANIVAGIVLTYMRPFLVGDRVKIADTIGVVQEKTLLVTRIRTTKNVNITIPNAMILNSHIINYSTAARNRGLILHTSVTIGYDVPWQKVHQLLIESAKGVEGLLRTPEPFVLQKSLEDFYVHYELNAYTTDPKKMEPLYSEIHKKIQEKFHEAGVEILSPHYGAMRDGNQIAIPEDQLPADYRPPVFRLGIFDKLFPIKKS